MKPGIYFRIFLAWLLPVPAVYCIAGFLGNYHASFLGLLFLTLLLQFAAGSLIHHLIDHALRLFRERPGDLLVLTGLFVALASFSISMYGAATHYPSLFNPGYLLLESSQVLPFFLGLLPSLPLLAWMGISADSTGSAWTGLHRVLGKIGLGLVLGGLYFSIYFMFASIFNQPAFDVDDIFFDSDGLLWRTRLATPEYRDYYWRSVHPYVLLLLRPPITLLSLLLKGDKLAAAFTLTAFAGALCVFLTWYFVRHVVGNSTYAALIASLLGASAAQLVFSSLIETYIFLSLAMMVFLLLLAKEGRLILLVFAGLASFGITIANFVPTAIAFLFVKRELGQWVKYGLIVAGLALPLTLLNNMIYPGSQPNFFDPSSYRAEAGNTFSPSLARGMAVGRVMFFHSMVSPTPLVLKEEIPFRKVWIFSAAPVRISEYAPGLGTGVALFWLVLLASGGLLFLRHIKTAELGFQLAFIAILVFNFIFHLQYGKDLFLYSTNWMYAIVLFLAIAWKELAPHRWFQITLLIFLVALLVNNAQLFHVMLGTSSLHIK